MAVSTTNGDFSIVSVDEARDITSHSRVLEESWNAGGKGRGGEAGGGGPEYERLRVGGGSEQDKSIRLVSIGSPHYSISA